MTSERPAKPPMNGASATMLVVGLVAVVVGALVAYNGWRDASSEQSVYDGLGVDLTANWTQLYVGIGIAAIGAILLLIQWVIASVRR